MKTDETPIYREIDGKLIQIPERAPNRRYSFIQNAATGEAYYKEFTDEEEKQRDLEAEKYKSEAPLREAEAKKQQEEFENFIETLEYEERIVAFLDVLGWSSAIKESLDNPELVKKMGIGINFIKKNQEIYEEFPMPFDLKITQFSDCIVISTDSEFHIDIGLHMALKMIILQFISLGFPVRGAITKGKLLHKGSMVYGPALVKAHYLENNIAVYPRILLDKMLSDKILGTGTTIRSKDGELLGHMKSWREDTDGWVFLDYLQPPAILPSDVHPHTLKATLEPVRKLINSGLLKYPKDSSEYTKYAWMKSYFNSVVQEYPKLNIEIIQ